MPHGNRCPAATTGREKEIGRSEARHRRDGKQTLQDRRALARCMRMRLAASGLVRRHCRCPVALCHGGNAMELGVGGPPPLPKLDRLVQMIVHVGTFPLSCPSWVGTKREHHLKALRGLCIVGDTADAPCLSRVRADSSHAAAATGSIADPVHGRDHVLPWRRTGCPQPMQAGLRIVWRFPWRQQVRFELSYRLQERRLRNDRVVPAWRPQQLGSTEILVGDQHVAGAAQARRRAGNLAARSRWPGPARCRSGSRRARCASAPERRRRSASLTPPCSCAMQTRS